MSAETQQPAPPRFTWRKVLDPEKLLQWLAKTAEDAMGLSYELNKMRAPSEGPAE
jgi:uncharacterized protein YndB with AHSA1/START domain